MKTNRFLFPMLYAVIGGLTVYLAVTFITPKPSTSQTPAAQGAIPIKLTSLQTSTGEVTDFSFSAELTVHAVVHVKTTSSRSDESYSFDNPLFDYFFGPRFRYDQDQPILGAGSGVIISTDGYIITNNHVVDKADNIEVVLNDKRTFDATVVGRDPYTDLAVIKINADELPYLKFGNSENLRLGEWVLAIGNPFNLNSTVTAGIVSAKARNINIMADQYAIESFIQTDAAVNPGNSGGALVNLKGELVGINTAIASRTGSFTGYSFAVPSSIAQKVAMDIIEYGEVQRAMLGVSISELNIEKAKKYNVDDLKGVLIAGIAEGGAAEEIGLKVGDVILEVNGVEVNAPNQLQEQISKYRPNDKITLLVNSSNKKKQYDVVLRNMRGGFEIVKADELIKPLGAEFKELDAKLKQKLGINYGLQVSRLSNGKLKEGGVKEGFIITKVNRANINSIDDLKKALGNVKGGVLIEGVYPNGLIAYYAIGI
ncbi:MAG: Do family serine endopeptidase [Tenuifilaceae bacterium]|nr:Do family serine endopeptidase [Bacteroidales bacterium]MDI9516466.1 Do family serine endopeptidase [Bacteroidota bacterium]NLH56868.1 Do family serine endopeptidase [Rikenellaceae bacterium]OQC62394.1 MAG: Periplasmic pH-dependent serine endoprotease DegQ precursor [Bacteroidetes bacterium ADurb.Bin008]HNV81855.1 Do family serine endopeptidase [Tenuifilaceae bacterium]